MTSDSWRIVTAVLLMLSVPIGFLIAVHTLTDDELDGVTYDPAPFIVSPKPQVIRDQQGVILRLEWQDGPVLRAPSWSGTVTARYVDTEVSIESGQRALSIDGIERVTFRSETPFYRALGPGASGKDVSALHDLLHLLGFISELPSDAGAYSFSTALAVQRFNESIGAPSSLEFDPSTIIWLPVSPFVVDTVGFDVGAPAPPPGSSLVTGRGRLSSVAVEPIQPDQPISIDPGVDYVLVKNGSRLEFDEQVQSLPSTSLDSLGELVDTGVEQTDAVIERATPVDAFSVPATAIMSNAAGGYCVWVADDADGSHYRAISVTLGRSNLGVTTILSRVNPADRVLSNPADVLSESQCP